MDTAGKIAEHCRILVITKAADGAMVYAGDQCRTLQAPEVKEIDSTECGDIFAATFFIRLNQGDDPWTAAAIANHLAAHSATRTGLESIPKPEEIKDALRLRVV